MKYVRKKPEVVNAIKVTAKHIDDPSTLPEEFHRYFHYCTVDLSDLASEHFQRNDEGHWVCGEYMRLSAGSYIVVNDMDEITLCDEVYFNKTYKEVK